MGIFDALFRQHRAEDSRPVGVGGLKGQDDISVLGAFLHRGNLVETVGASRQKVRSEPAIRLPGSPVIGVVNGATRVPLSLRVEVQGHDLLTTLGLHVRREDVIRVRLRGAVFGDIEVGGTHEPPYRCAQVSGVAVDVQGVPLRRQLLDGQTQRSAVLELTAVNHVELSHRGRLRCHPRLLTSARLVLLSAPGECHNQHGQHCHRGHDCLAQDVLQ